jgi:hypothetical protein
MLRSATAASGNNGLRSWFARLAVTLMVLAAFTVQANVSQSHIHGSQPASFADVFVQKFPGQTRAPQNLPTKQDPSDCPVCRLFVQAGTYVAPSTVMLLQPLFVHGVLTLFADVTQGSQTSSHSWRSRGPPLSH